MNRDEGNIGGGTILIIAVIVLGYFLIRANQQVNSLNKALSMANSNISQLNLEIDQANSDIEDLNGQMYDAQSYAWSDYYTMGSTLENLNPIEDSFDTLPTVSSSTSSQ